MCHTFLFPTALLCSYAVAGACGSRERSPYRAHAMSPLRGSIIPLSRRREGRSPSRRRMAAIYSRRAAQQLGGHGVASERSASHGVAAQQRSRETRRRVSRDLSSDKTPEGSEGG